MCRKHGISPATFYQWTAKFDGLEVSEAHRPLTSSEAPNQRWSLDFVSATLTNRCRLGVPCGVNDFARECPGLGRQSIPVLSVLAWSRDRTIGLHRTRKAPGQTPQPDMFPSPRPARTVLAA